MNIFIRTLYFYYYFLLVIKLKWFLWTFRKVGFEWRKFPFQGVYAWIDGNPFYFCWDSGLTDLCGSFSSYLDCDSCQMKQDAALLLTA